MPYQDPNSDNLYNSRKEDKYICLRADLDAILEEVEYYLKPYYPTKNTDFVNITSTYMDTPSLEFLLQHLDGGDRKKIRLRCYAPNGKPQADKFLEIKYREDGHKKKARIEVDALALAQAIGGEDLPKGNRKLNSELSDEDYSDAVNLIKEACAPGLSPILQVTYKRLSYESGDIRVTIDQDIEATSFATLKSFDGSELRASPDWKQFEELGTAYSPSKNIVVEVKYAEDEEPPKWITKLLEKYAHKQASFSKYVYGLYEEIS